MSDPVTALQESAYYGVVRAFYAGNRLGFDVEDFLDELRTVLQVSEPRHVEFLDVVQRDAEAAQLNSYAPSIAAATAPSHNPAAGLAMQSSMSIPISMQHGGILSLHDPSMYALGGHTVMTPVAEVPGSGGLKKSKKGSNAGTPREVVPKRPPPLATAGYGNAPKKTKMASTPVSTPKSGNKKAAGGGGGYSGVKSTGGSTTAASSLHQNGGTAGVLVGGFAAAEAQLVQLNAREREIFTELISLGVTEDDPELNGVHRALLKWYKLDQRQQELQRELATL